MIKKYIEVKQYKGSKCVKRVDVSHRSPHSIDTIENGMNRNMNHKDFYSVQIESETKLNTF